MAYLGEVVMEEGLGEDFQVVTAGQDFPLAGVVSPSVDFVVLVPQVGQEGASRPADRVEERVSSFAFVAECEVQVPRSGVMVRVLG